MLFQDDILFYNVAELPTAPDYPGQLLSRFPTSLIEQMDIPLPAQFSRGCELRFWLMPNDAPVTVNLYALEGKGDGQAIVFFGEHYVNEFALPEGQITPIEIAMDPMFHKHLAQDDGAEGMRFPSTLCRVFLNNETKVSYCGKGALSEVQKAAFGVPFAPLCETRNPAGMPFVPLFCEDGSRNLAKDPTVNKMPSQVAPYQAATPSKDLRAMGASKRFLAYGSSITHGSSTSSNSLCYIQLGAQNLGCDVVNLGMSGSCTCDKAVADYIAAQPDIDFYFLELGVNMRHRYYVEEFEERLVYLLKALQGRKVYITTIYPNRATSLEVDNGLSMQERAFNDLIRKHAPIYGAHLLEGSDILKNTMWLTHDWIHPSPLGHMKMAETFTQLLSAERNTEPWKNL